jgi:predicted ATPase
MRRFILTGAPGSGKTSILRQLELDGFSVVEEAATDVIALQQSQGIAEPWTHPSFIDSVASIQRERQLHAANFGEIQFHDRSVICTVALAMYLRYSISKILQRELDRIREEKIFESQVFLIQNLGFITATAARRISFEESLCFDKIHEDAYRNFGFELVFIPPGTVPERAVTIKRAATRR